jgi:uncharacterized membrane protein
VTERRLIDPHSALTRVAVSLATGLLAGGVATWQGLNMPLLLGWNMAGATLMLLAWLLIANCDEKVTRQRAGAEDPGRSFVYAIVIVASVVSLLAAFQLSRHVGNLPAAEAATSEVMCLVTVALAWGLTHTSFTLRYAHLYYREDDEGVGGVEFPGHTAPSYMDFAYFAFTLGMCFQTSDVCITSPVIRRAALFHAIISFAYNTAIIAFVLNLVFGKMS